MSFLDIRTLQSGELLRVKISQTKVTNSKVPQLVNFQADDVILFVGYKVVPSMMTAGWNNVLEMEAVVKDQTKKITINAQTAKRPMPPRSSTPSSLVGEPKQRHLPPEFSESLYFIPWLERLTEDMCY
jgi:hypothetical protein